MITEFIEHRLFPTVVYQNTIPVNQSELDIVKGIEYERMPSNNGHFTKMKDVLSVMPETRKAIEEHIKYYTKEVLSIMPKYNFPIMDSWVNKHEEQDEAQKHFHANALISGVYYLQTPPDCGNIKFHKPTNHNNFLNEMLNFETIFVNERNAAEYVIDVKEGMLLLFPSQVYHSTQINKAKSERYSLAFNTWVSGIFGTDIDKLEL
tara:strand:- start:2784 stop:3401 length:618 start_codon:yes stop_codon:yes gene_type:complete